MRPAPCVVALLLLVTAGTAQPVTVRLVGGSDPRAGRLEVHYNGWGTVCKDYFTNAAATVVCYMLGYGRSGWYIGYHYGGGRGTIWMDNVQCNGTETNIADCSHSSWGHHNCDHGEDVSVSCIPDSTEAVALVGGGNPRVGRLEVFHGTQWGTVCDDGFTDASARVVCYSLGFGHVGRKVDVNQYGVGDGRIWLNNVNCGGRTEQYIGECSLEGWRNHNCSHQQDVAVSCTENTAVTSVRLAGGSSSTGRLEVFHDGLWGTVCGDFFTAAAASVVCNMLRLGPGTKIHNSRYITSEGQIWLDDVRCNGTETDIAKCAHSDWGVHNCQHNDDVAISCALTKVEVRLNGGRDPREGRLEVFHNGTWRSVCRDRFNDAAARVVCNMLGFGDVGRPTTNNYGYGLRPFWLQSVQCSGTEKSIVECVDNGRGHSRPTCSPGEEQAVSCIADGSVALFGSGHPRKGRLEVYHDDTWGTVCDDGFTDAAARVVCYSLGFGYVGYKKNAINYGLGTGRIWLDNVWCEGKERHISECSRIEWGVHNCGHDKDIAVVCFVRNLTINYDDCDIYGKIGTSLVPVYYFIFFGLLVIVIIKWRPCCERLRRVLCCCRRRRQRTEVMSLESVCAGVVNDASSIEPSAHAPNGNVAEPPPRYDQVLIYTLLYKNSSGDEIANVNFLTTISHTRRPTSKYRKRDKPTSFNKLDDR